MVPTYNRSGVLERLLVALAAQESAPPFEVVVVDDGSTDRTEAVAGAASARYVRQPNSGPAAARNRGWRAAGAPLVAFTDDDTVPTPHWLAELRAAALHHPDAAAVGGRIVALAPTFLATFVQLERHVDHGVDPDLGVRYLVTANAIWRRDVLVELGGFNERFAAASGEDTDLSMRARRAGYELAVVDGAEVAHDHRASLRAILRTYRKHGTSRRVLVDRHPQEPWGRRSRTMGRPSYWLRRFRYYRSHGCSTMTATCYLGLHFVGLVSYATGILSARSDARRKGATT